MIECIGVLLCPRRLCGRTGRFRTCATISDDQFVPVDRVCGTVGYSGNLTYIHTSVFGIICNDGVCMRQVCPREHRSHRYALGNCLWNVFPMVELICLLFSGWGRGRGRSPTHLDVRRTENDLIIPYRELGAVEHIVVILGRSVQRYRTVVGITRHECYSELLEIEIRGYCNIGCDSTRCIRP